MADIYNNEDDTLLVPEVPVDVNTADVVPELPLPAVEPECCGEAGLVADCAPTIESFFGTLQEAVTIIWRYHLKTSKYSYHQTLHELYHDILWKVDRLIELYQGIQGLVNDYINVIIPCGKSETVYLSELRDFIRVSRESLIPKTETELWSLIDDLLSSIDSAKYKIDTFVESPIKTFESFCYENLNSLNECGCNGDDCDYTDDEITDEDEEEE
jgi:hypothetical protein